MTKTAEVTNQSVLNIFNAAILQKKSAGARIRDIFAEVLADGKITVEVMNQLTNEQFTKSILNIKYAFLKRATKNPNDRKINGRARYGMATIEINGEKFWVTNWTIVKKVDTKLGIFFKVSRFKIIGGKKIICRVWSL